jgi:uncharacterized membrane protein
VIHRWLAVALLLAVGAAGASVFAYYGLHDRLPEQVPIHWNIRGEADGFVPRDGALSYLLILPGVMFGMVLLGLVLPWLSPRGFELDRFRDTFFYIIALITAMFGYLHLVTLAAGFGLGFDLNRVLLGGLFLFLALLGNVLGKVQRNFFVGIRTPWTLASEAVWIRTHRLGAWLFTAGGLAAAVAALAGLHPVVSFVVFGVAALTPVFYSLWLYKKLQKEGRLGEPS